MNISDGEIIIARSVLVDSGLVIEVNIILCIVSLFLITIGLDIAKLFVIEIKSEFEILFSKVIKQGSLALTKSIQLYRVVGKERYGVYYISDRLLFIWFWIIMIEVSALVFILIIEMGLFF